MRRCLIASLFLWTVLGRGALGAEKEVVQQYVEAVSRIKSYDVQFNITTFAYPDVDNPKKENRVLRINDETIRDVFAVGLGRRVERSVNDLEFHSIAVKDWKAASNGQTPISISFTYGIDGLNYFDYYNPNCWGNFLDDLIRKDDATVKALEPKPANDFIGLEVTHKKLYGPIRLWVDPQHGYMPVIIEKYVHAKDGTTGLKTKSEIERFIQIGGAWVPVAAKYTSFVPAGRTSGRADSAFSISVNQDRSSWNSVTSSDLFEKDSLATVNNFEGGWSRQLPPALLDAAKRDQELRQSIKGTLVRNTGRVLMIGLNIAFILVLILFVIWKRRKHHTHAGAV